MKVHSIQGDTVDMICYRYYGRTAGVTEQVLEANPGLSVLGPVLPMGTPLNLPDQAKPAQQKTVNLWD